MTTRTLPTSAIFTAAATLTPAEPQHFDLAFDATTQPCPWPKAYGGDLVAQAAVAAMRSVTDGKTLDSMQSYFLRPRRYRRDDPLRGRSAARRPRLQHPAGPRVPEREADLCLPGQLRGR
ncbi:hypothetical protein [Nocardia seriolae]|uniref:Acyl-CoA thioesterase n=1 Tax=Nocardia seriolae TaxID=37332 RepID=A0ABC9YWG1_9NOCA|nr:hypothetical protein [Nocardia seriolae]WKY54887.1 hypothetical protein Q5P07_13125 [Nocardia seriolae]WNJ56918.1 hypothetical protein RMO66_26140 [Nocardia seriolae]BEK94727.1 hypothetical protein NSER024013_26330 [Nocardia seriolae]GAM47974.1 acyl-CoA thioesterase [Nocardia seriolae]GAP29848.1 acyl-CoA thioesterase [Nocardia seriolae]